MTSETILPQPPTDERVEVDSVEWLFEPDWPGRRLVVRVDGDAVGITDASGEAVSDASIAEIVRRATRAGSAVLDGVRTDRGLALSEHGTDAEPATPSFVAIDLLELDGEPLLDVPFQERRRLLESVIEEGSSVRVSPVVKQPLGGWLAGWREAGFTHYLARHQNARYRPGERSDDVLRIPVDAAPATPGFLQRVVGRRGPGRIRRRHDVRS